MGTTVGIPELMSKSRYGAWGDGHGWIDTGEDLELACLVNQCTPDSVTACLKT